MPRNPAWDKWASLTNINFGYFYDERKGNFPRSLSFPKYPVFSALVSVVFPWPSPRGLNCHSESVCLISDTRAVHCQDESFIIADFIVWGLLWYPI